MEEDNNIIEEIKRMKNSKEILRTLKKMEDEDDPILRSLKEMREESLRNLANTEVGGLRKDTQREMRRTMLEAFIISIPFFLLIIGFSVIWNLFIAG